MDAERFEKARNHVVRGDGGHQLDELLVAEVLAQLRHQRLVDVHLAGHLLGQGEHAPFLVAEPARGLPIGQVVDLRLADAFLERDGDVLVGLVWGAVDLRDAHDHQFAQRAAQAGLLAHRREVVEPALGDGRTVQQHLVQVQDAAAFRDDALDQRARLLAAEIGVRDSSQGLLLLVAGCRMAAFPFGYGLFMGCMNHTVGAPALRDAPCRPAAMPHRWPATP